MRNFNNLIERKVELTEGVVGERLSFRAILEQ
jgi:hypothetical protein